MSGEKTRGRIESGKSSTKKRLEQVERLVHESIRGLAIDIQAVAANQQDIVESLEAQDEVLAALKALIIEKGVATDEEIEAKVTEIQDIKVRVRELHRKQMELRKADPDVARLMDSAHDPSIGDVPEEAFIFGG